MSRSIMHYAVYDISDTPTRTSVANALKDMGLERVQKSVFCGTLSEQSKKDLLERVGAILGAGGGDSFYLIMTCSLCFGNIVSIGEAFDTEYVEGKKPAVVF